MTASDYIQLINSMKITDKSINDIWERKEFAQKMAEINEFCIENGISQSLRGDSYYFNINGVNYRVSNHTIEASNRKAFNQYGEQIRDIYHPNGRDEDTVYITASKTRIIDIYNDLKNGFELDKRGNRKG